jgi:hypothetical protein
VAVVVSTCIAIYDKSKKKLYVQLQTSGLFGYVVNGAFVGISTTTQAPPITTPATTLPPSPGSNTTDNSTTVAATTASTTTPAPTTTAQPSRSFKAIRLKIKGTMFFLLNRVFKGFY